ncbi:hypothetical protein [Bifidobacterium biavatii]|uniref:Lipoprotein n=1 Tax=Bifidobacterium biavatii DSM 23969 TaxID=1437608 RepID=A0A086ZYW4_9BIFI|nr:hypothetical protein [Bifidobacterium biavatii]KFI51714.1 hypothetical protein BBIA_0627 [Bifidobacterium biavatii DSM 23969]
MMMNRRMKLLLAVLWLAVVLSPLLAGCAEGTYEDPYVVGDQADDYSWSYVKLPDGRLVPCITGNSGAISCDWAHADGADKGWSQ